MFDLSIIKKYKYPIFIGFNLLWIWALLSPSIYYFDDNYRAAGGYYNWGGDFRPFADWLYYLLGLGRRFTDLTPLPQIISLLFLYLIVSHYVNNFFDTWKNFEGWLVFSPIFLSPFLLSNLYFRYDSLFMMLAVLFSVLAIHFVNQKRYIFATCLLYFTLGLYQPAIVAYVCTALFVIYKLNSNNSYKSFQLWFRQSLLYFVIFAVSLVLYYFTIMKFTTDFNWYSTTHSQMSIANAVPNLTVAIREISILFQGDSGYIYLVIFIYLLLLNVIYFFKLFSYLGLIAFLIVHFSFVCTAAGVNLFLDVPRFEYRTFIFYGFYTSFLLLSAYKIILYYRLYKCNCFLLFFVNFYFLSISLNVSNAQKYKENFDDMVIFDLLETIHNNKSINKNTTIIFYGESTPYTVQQIVYKYPVIKNIIANGSYYTYKIQNFFPYQLKYIKFRGDKEKFEYYLEKNKKFEIVDDRLFYYIASDSNNNLLIYFKPLEKE
ncbi:Glucosyl transferase GtrII [Acinetobacter marinus]|uniref:Glucosyl transferase GtrII n=1 Tax=Acinetobacter marinus TaxID=281375 RepID=A0A1G6KH34_9GAMM|nr:glucosyltransferase domain-containing protein [Acinetobacter marinus]SDC29885.1 Glucosyl transferase GtrII [Acinetobacter marinus]